MLRYMSLVYRNFATNVADNNMYICVRFVLRLRWTSDWMVESESVLSWPPTTDTIYALSMLVYVCTLCGVGVFWVGGLRMRTSRAIHQFNSLSMGIWRLRRGVYLNSLSLSPTHKQTISAARNCRKRRKVGRSPGCWLLCYHHHNLRTCGHGVSFR